MKNIIFAITLCYGVFATADNLSSVATKADQSYSVASNEAVNVAGAYFDWGRAQNGFGYCYQWANPGQVLNGGAAQPNFYCEQVNPSFFNWGRAANGFGYCYQFTGNGLLMNLGQPQSNYSCEQRSPSHYAWARGQDGYTRCYQFSPSGLALNSGQPVNNYFCQ